MCPAEYLSINANLSSPKKPYYVYNAPSPRNDGICSNVTNIVFDERTAIYIPESKLDS